jgi:ArsR family transcriptional regulator
VRWGKVKEIQDMAENLKLLGDKSRLTILALLKEQDLCVCDIKDILEMSQPSISQHLRKLKSSGLVNEKRRGQWVYYSLNVQDKQYIQSVLDFVPCLKEKLAQFELNTCD